MFYTSEEPLRKDGEYLFVFSSDCGMLSSRRLSSQTFKRELHPFKATEGYVNLYLEGFKGNVAAEGKNGNNSPKSTAPHRGISRIIQLKVSSLQLLLGFLHCHLDPIQLHSLA